MSHRDYRMAGSIFAKQFPTKLPVTSPGGFPAGISPENIVYKQAPRNRRIAEALARCGLIERAGQGADRMFGAAIREGKLPPGFAGTDAYQVAITLHGKVQDESFLVFLERLSREQQISLHIDDLLVLDAVHRQLPVDDPLKARLEPLIALGAVERVGRGRGVRYLLAPSYYKAIGKPGAYTRKRGLDRDTNKALLLKHLERSGDEGCPLSELLEVLPALSTSQVRHLLADLRVEGVAHRRGATKSSRWHLGRWQGRAHPLENCERAASANSRRIPGEFPANSIVQAIEVIHMSARPLKISTRNSQLIRSPPRPPMGTVDARRSLR